ncbi:hypothetical protein MNV49_004939 [Pseudohyphozyma bogoriensis]|nr:hypothetical protein MNV49_004939 [Pseudohyphozyma bogoriensis]
MEPLLSPVIRLSEKIVWGLKFERYERFGSTAYYCVSPFDAPCLAVCDAVAIREIGSKPDTFQKPMELYDLLSPFGPNLFASQGTGPEWRRHRKVVAPAFNEKNNEMVWDETIKSCDEWFAVMDEAAVDDAFDEKEAVSKSKFLSFMVICRAGFNKDLSWRSPGMSTSTRGASSKERPSFPDAVQAVLNSLLLDFLLPKLPFSPLHHVVEERAEFESQVKEMIQQRETSIDSGEELNDLFANLVQASNAETESARLSNQEIVADSGLMLVAGHETSGHTLAAALMMLALFPEHQTPILNEAIQVFAGAESPPYTCYRDLKWALATFNETLRMFPPGVVIGRRCVTNTSLTIHTRQRDGSWAPKQIVVEQGTFVVSDIVANHYNPSIYPDPGTFIPSRFLDKGDAKWDREAFMPFFTGPRRCPGKTFALVEGAAVLAKIVLQYQVELLPSLMEEYKRREGESKEGHLHRVLKAYHALTLTPTGLGIRFVRRRS